MNQPLDPNADPRALRSLRQLPARFNADTELTFEVPAAGTDAANFDLTWR